MNFLTILIVCTIVFIITVTHNGTTQFTIQKSKNTTSDKPINELLNDKQLNTLIKYARGTQTVGCDLKVGCHYIFGGSSYIFK